MRGKKQVLSIILAGAGLIGFVVALFFVFFAGPGLDDNYFINSDRRIVSTMNIPSSKLMFGAKTLHKVYEVDNDKITSYKLYYVFDDAGQASENFDGLKAKALEDLNKKEVTRNGKYIIVTMDKSMYEKSTPDEIRKIVRELETNQRNEQPSQQVSPAPTEGSNSEKTE